MKNRLGIIGLFLALVIMSSMSVMATEETSWEVIENQPYGEETDEIIEHVETPQVNPVKEYARYNHKAEVTFYFMTAHPGSSAKEARQLAEAIKEKYWTKSVQIFTPTPMTVSTCMYHTGLNPRNKRPVHVPYTYREKKIQKQKVFGKPDQNL